MSPAARTERPSPQAQAERGVAVPLLDLTRQYAQIREEVLAAIERVCASQKFILGEEVAALEAAVAGFVGATEAVGCASGSDAVWLALAGAGVEPGDDVITTGFSFFATASAIVRLSARPVLADIDPETLILDPRKVEAKVRSRRWERLRALLPVHLYGQCAEMDAFQELAAEHRLQLVEDAAQAFGATWRGRRAGSLGVAAAFSFYPTKNLGAYGDGGCVTTSDAAVARRVRILRDHGSPERYHHEEMGWNSRLDALQAAILAVKLRYVESWNERRRQRASLYGELFAQAGLATGSAGASHAPIRLLQTAPPAGHVYHQYVIRAARRDELRSFLAQRRIATEVYYPVPLHLQKALRYLGYAPGDLPECERAAREVLALPMFAELTDEEQNSVVSSIADFYS